MENSVIPSETKNITRGQISKIYDNLEHALLKANLLSEPSQIVLEHQMNELVDDFVGSFRKRVDALSEMIVHRVKVDLSRTQYEAIQATDRREYIAHEVVESMPKAESEEVEVFFFKEGTWLTDDELEKKFTLRGLVPVDPMTLSAMNETEPSFADKYPNGTHWKDEDGNWCFVTFRHWCDEREVSAYRFSGYWRDYWWFAGRRKYLQGT